MCSWPSWAINLFMEKRWRLTCIWQCLITLDLLILSPLMLAKKLLNISKWMLSLDQINQHSWNWISFLFFTWLWSTSNLIFVRVQNPTPIQLTKIKIGRIHTHTPLSWKRCITSSLQCLQLYQNNSKKRFRCIPSEHITSRYAFGSPNLLLSSSNNRRLPS